MHVLPPDHSMLNEIKDDMGQDQPKQSSNIEFETIYTDDNKLKENCRGSFWKATGAAYLCVLYLLTQPCK